MEKPRYRLGTLGFICMAILFLGLISFSFCIASEFKKAKAKDVKLDGTLCYLPRSPAFGLGIAAFICLLAVQIIGNSVVFMQFYPRGEKPVAKSRNCRVAISLVVLSWFSSGIAILLLGVATSMNEKQAYGKGWSDGECCIVKDGVYSASAALVMTTIVLMLGPIVSTTTRLSVKPVEQGRKVYVVCGEIT